MSEKLWLIRTTEDGEVGIWPVVSLLTLAEEVPDVSDFVTEAQLGGGDSDLAAGEHPCILIRGEILVPRAKTVATDYELP